MEKTEKKAPRCATTGEVMLAIALWHRNRKQSVGAQELLQDWLLLTKLCRIGGRARKTDPAQLLAMAEQALQSGEENAADTALLAITAAPLERLWSHVPRSNGLRRELWLQAREFVFRHHADPAENQELAAALLQQLSSTMPPGTLEKDGGWVSEKGVALIVRAWREVFATELEEAARQRIRRKPTAAERAGQMSLFEPVAAIG